MKSILNMYKHIVVLIFTVLVFSVSPALAQVTFTSNEAQFLADNPDSALQTFLNQIIPANQFANCNSPVNRASNDNCFSPGDILPVLEITINQLDVINLFALIGPSYRGSGSPANVLTSSIVNTSFDMAFPPTGADAVGMLLGCLQVETGFCNETLTVLVIGQDGGVLGQTTVPGTNLFNTFLGIESTEPIARVSVLLPGAGENVQGAWRIWFKLANRPIPTLSEWGMIAAAAGLMLVGVFFAVRKRLQASNEFDE